MTELQHEAINKLILCLEQKNLFIVTILDITKQLEVKTQNDEIDFEDLLQTRGEQMTRIDMCSAMEKNVVASLPDEDKDLVKQALSGGEIDFEDDSLSAIQRLANNYSAYLKALVVADKEAVDKLRARYEHAKTKVKGRTLVGSNMFSR